MCFPWGWEGTQGAWRCNGIQCRLQKFCYSCNSLSQRHGPPESHISSQLSPPHKTEGEELEGRTGNSCLSWASPDIPVTLPSNQNELDPKALVLTGFESHPCHLVFFFFFFFFTLSFLEMHCLATCCLFLNIHAYNCMHALGDTRIIFECLWWPC